MSTSSPVTERTTSGPVTKIRPSGPRITMSVSAGPYAAPPAAGPSTTEICGTLPEAWVMAWKISPTACSDSTPSAQPGAAGVPEADDRAPGRRAPARRRARRPCSRPRPSRRPSRWRRSRTRPTWVPSTLPTAASMPLPSSAVISSSGARRRRAPRAGGSGCAGPARGAASAGPRRGCGAVRSCGGHCCQALRKATATLWPPKPKELFSAARSPSGSVARLGGDVQVDVGVGVVEVDRRRHQRSCSASTVAMRLQRAGARRAGARSSTWWR